MEWPATRPLCWFGCSSCRRLPYHWVFYGAARAIRLALIDENNTAETMGGSLWVIWLAVAALAPAFWPSGPRGALDFFLLVPLDLLAAVTVADLVNRRVPVRTLIVLAPATAMTVAWWASEDLQGAVDDLMHGRADAATALGLHLALDLILLSIWFTRRLDRWARRRDDRQRCVLAFFLLTILAITVGTGVREVVFRHSETHDLLTLRTMILRRNRERPFELLAVVGPEVVTAPRQLHRRTWAAPRGAVLRRLAAVHPPHRASASAATRPEQHRWAAGASGRPAADHLHRIGPATLLRGKVQARPRNHSSWSNGNS